MAAQALRPYQERARALILDAFKRGKRRILAVCPTGGGKTTIFSSLASDLVPHKMRALVLVHRHEARQAGSAALHRVRSALRVRDARRACEAVCACANRDGANPRPQKTEAARAPGHSRRSTPQHRCNLVSDARSLPRCSDRRLHGNTLAPGREAARWSVRRADRDRDSP